MIIRTHDIIDRSDALDLQVSRADISFDKVSFSYNSSQKLFDKMSVFIPAGQKVGVSQEYLVVVKQHLLI